MGVVHDRGCLPSTDCCSLSSMPLLTTPTTTLEYLDEGTPAEDEGRPRYDDTQRRLDEWPPIPVPSTFLIGTADGCETLAPARTNADFFPAGRTLVELDGVGHFIQRERPDVVAQHILRALGRPQPGVESRP